MRAKEEQCYRTKEGYKAIDCSKNTETAGAMTAQELSL